MESILSNALQALGKRNGGEVGTIFECIFSNACQAFGEDDGGEGAAIIESMVLNGRHTLGEGNGSEIAATIESSFSDDRHALGDNRRCATCDQCIAISLYNGVTPAARVIYGIVFCNIHTDKVRTL